MKKILHVILITLFSFTIISCSEDKKESTTDTTATSQMGGAIQGTELSLSTAVTTLAGSSEGSTDATGTSASFRNPDVITTDGTNLYVGDKTNHLIRKIE